MLKRLLAAFIALCAFGAGHAVADDVFRAGLTIRAGFGGNPQQEWVPHLQASFGSGPQFLAQGHTSESQCLMTAGDLRFSNAVSSVSACQDAPLLMFDVHNGGFGSANLLGLNLLKAPGLFQAHGGDMLSGNSEWVNWTLKQHNAGYDLETSTLGLSLLPPLKPR